VGHGDPVVRAITELSGFGANTPWVQQRAAKTRPGSAEILSIDDITPVGASAQGYRAVDFSLRSGSQFRRIG
jgi:hypothetical protein